MCHIQNLRERILVESQLTPANSEIHFRILEDGWLAAPFQRRER